MKNFAITGVAGYIAPRHLKAIKDTHNNVVAALDPHDSVGIMDNFFPEARFFTEFERFERHVEKLHREDKGKEVDFVTICTPNYLHDSHVRFALRVGADAICEKPLVLNPWNVDALLDLENETGKKVYTILQLRVHPLLIELRKKIQKEKNNKKYEVDLTYITSRGSWYLTSWKGQIEKSGGLATNIGIHFFDLLIWLFGNVQQNEVHYSDPKTMSGYIELENARVRWYLSIDEAKLPKEIIKKGQKTYRSLTINSEEVEFSEGFTDLHTKVYEDILSGGGYGLEATRPSIELAEKIRNAKISTNSSNTHPFNK
ncbi:MAG: Gfo/Idh/MocA family oxidoreductase [bacterium]|nr:Gfo/Idh/MocA family oxidoreductase [bacterium]